MSRLLTVLGAVVGASVAAATVGAAVMVWDEYHRQETSSPHPDDRGMDQAAVAPATDYNCSLPGRGFPWLEWTPDVRMYADDRTSRAGVFGTDVAGGAEFRIHLPVSILPDGTPRMDHAYTLLCATHPELGGTDAHLMSADEIRSLDADWGWVDEDFDPAAHVRWLYTDGRSRGANDAHLFYEATRIFVYPPMSDALLDALARPTASSSSSPSTSTAKDSRRYRVVVNGFENAIPEPTKATGNGVRFDYRLVGEFTIGRTDASSPWKVVASRIVTAEVEHRSLYPADTYQVELSCEYRSCERLRDATRLGVQVLGEEVIVSWGYFYPYVNITGTCTECPGPVDRWVKSDYFFSKINAATLPLQTSYLGPQTVETYSTGEVSISFRYGLELVP